MHKSTLLFQIWRPSVLPASASRPHAPPEELASPRSGDPSYFYLSYCSFNRKFFYKLFWKHCVYLNAFFLIDSEFPVKSSKHLLLNNISKYLCSCKSEIDPRTNFTRNSVRPSPIHCAPLPFDLGPSRAHFPKISLSFFSARDLKLLSWGDAAGILQECCGDTGGMIRECCGNAAGILRGCCREAVGILLGCCGDAEKI